MNQNNNQNQDEKKITASNYFNISRTDDAEFQRTFLVNKKLDSLHKEIDILKIFDSFKNIVNLSSINELKSQFNDNNKFKITEKKPNTIGSNCLNDISILYNSLPKIPNFDSIHKKSKETEQSSFNWSPIDLPDPRKKKKTKIRSPRKLQGFSINNRKINFSKSDSIFITNATAEKTFITNQMQKSGMDKDDNNNSKRYFRDKNTSANLNFDQTNNQSSYFPIET